MTEMRKMTTTHTHRKQVTPGKKKSAESSSSSSTPSTLLPSSTAVPQQQQQPLPYQHQNPLILLIGFLITSLLVIYCSYHFYTLRHESNLNSGIIRSQDEMQLVHERQVELNFKTREKWNLYAEHRGNITAVLLELAERSGMNSPSLCILGAGNLNDVTLSQLIRSDEADSSATATKAFASVALVDLDERAMQAGVLRQMTYNGLSESVRDSGSIKMYSADITSSYNTFNAWKKESIRHHAFHSYTNSKSKDKSTVIPPFPSESVMDEWRRSMQTHPNPPAAAGKQYVRAKGMPSIDASTNQRITYDVVASICILSQLLDMYMSIVSDSHPSYLSSVLTIREHHISLILDLLKPGGLGILITDIVSSASVPSLVNATHADLPFLLPTLVESSNFFTGLNPNAISAKLATHFSDVITQGSVRVLTPWKWTIGGDSDKKFLVYAFVFQKKKE